MHMMRRCHQSYVLSVALTNTSALSSWHKLLTSVIPEFTFKTKQAPGSIVVENCIWFIFLSFWRVSELKCCAIKKGDFRAAKRWKDFLKLSATLHFELQHSDALAEGWDFSHANLLWAGLSLAGTPLTTLILQTQISPEGEKSAVAQIHRFEISRGGFDTAPGFVAGFMTQIPLCWVLSSATLPNRSNAMTQLYCVSCNMELFVRARGLGKNSFSRNCSC